MPRKQPAITEFLSKHPERVKWATSQSRVKTDDLVQLIRLFPDIDRDYARLALQSYTQDAVACVTAKLLDRNYGNYPRHNFKDSYVDRNALLKELNALFSEHDVTELREALSMQSYSNFYRAVDDLLQLERQVEKQIEKKEKDIVTIRTRVGLDRGSIQPHENFRSEEYQVAVYKRLRLEFAEHDSPSSIRAVLGEHNYDYERTRMALGRLFTKKSLWSMFKSLFSPNAKEAAEKQLRQNPSTGCAELDAEIAAIKTRQLKEERTLQIQSDFLLAQKCNEEEHEMSGEMIECGCCFGEYTWEDMTCCNSGHLVCRSCVTHTAQECAFGQGDNAYDPRGLKCIAASNEKCDEVIPTKALEGVLSTDLMTRYSQRVLATELDTANLNLVRCPFCLYSEFKEESALKIRLHPICRGFAILLLIWITLLNPLILANLTIPSIICIYFTDLLQWKQWDIAINEAYQRQNNTIQENARTFKCGNEEECGRESCLECGKEWAPFHDCLKDEKDGLRLYIEKAMADAVKRTCPRCNVGFIKSDGCNLMHCRCGFVMCYVCRQDVEQQGYQHFCQHFRPLGGACKSCNKCGLYDKEDEEQAIQEARMRGTQEYLARHPNAVKAVRANVRERYLARRNNIQTPVTAQKASVLDDCIDLIMEYGKDWLFETYASG